ncbi:MAG: hypothetical protein HW412_2271 [Bacteroidetes bacterium]|nr:hypothetical protein [Bacteroidota bacterium]
MLSRRGFLFLDGTQQNPSIELLGAFVLHDYLTLRPVTDLKNWYSISREAFAQ